MNRKFSILAMMGAIIFVALGLAAFRTASAVWASIVFTIAFLATLSASIGSLALQGRARAAWGGFAIACGGCLWASFGPLADAGGIKPPPLLTTPLLQYTSKFLGNEDRVREYDPPENIFFDGAVNPPSLPVDIGNLPTASSLPPPSMPEIVPMQHRRIGHSLMALILGICGSIFGWMLSRRGSVEKDRIT